MPRFTVNPGRRASYKGTSFAVEWEGRYVPGVRLVSGLTRRTDVVSERGGRDACVPTASPGLTSYDPLVLERGRTHDDAFERWANEVYDRGRAGSGETSLATYRKDVGVELRNAAGQVAMAFVVYDCWPSEYTALDGLDADESAVATERLVLQHSGFERDEAVTEPAEPSFAGGRDGNGEEETEREQPGAADRPAFGAIDRWRSDADPTRWIATDLDADAARSFGGRDAAGSAEPEPEPGTETGDDGGK